MAFHCGRMREGSKKKCWIFELIVEHTLDLIQ